jgi:hypothetical protein
MYETLVYTKNVNLLGDPMKNSEALMDTSKEVGLEVNTGKPSTCCYLLTRMQGKIMT